MIYGNQFLVVEVQEFYEMYPCGVVLYDFQGKTKIAAITANNDGRPFIKG